MHTRELWEPAELEACLDVQRRAWGLQDIDIVPSHLLRVYSDPKEQWGVLVGAFDGSSMIGFALCLPTTNPQKLLMHMIGVLPGVQQRGVGHAILGKLREIAGGRNVTSIVWTYDPLESVNANLYIAKNGAICKRYVEDYYHTHGSLIHSGFPADRFKAEMFLDDSVRAQHVPHPTETMRIEIPPDLQALRRSDATSAMRWREQTRPCFRKINSDGFVVVGFRFEDGRAWYDLVR